MQKQRHQLLSSRDHELPHHRGPLNSHTQYQAIYLEKLTREEIILVLNSLASLGSVDWKQGT